MRKWKRVDTADGPRFRSALAAHEAALLQSLVTSMIDMLEDRESSSPADELEEITGMRTGNSRLREDDTMKRLLPDFFRPQNDHPAGSGTAESLNSALRSLHEPEIIDAKRHAAQRVLDTLPAGRRQVRDRPRTMRTLGRRASTTCGLRWAPCSRSARTAPTGLPPEHPMAGHLDVYQWLTVLQEYLVLGL